MGNAKTSSSILGASSPVEKLLQAAQHAREKGDMVQAAKMTKAAENLENWSDAELDAAASRALLKQSAASSDAASSRLARVREQVIADIVHHDDDAGS